MARRSTRDHQQDYWAKARAAVLRAKWDRDVPDLVSYLDAPRALVGKDGRLLPDIRNLSLRALSKVGDDRAVPALTKLVLDDPDEYARSVAAEALGHIGDRQAIPALLDVLGDGDDLVRHVRTPRLRKLIEEGVERAQEPGVPLRLWALSSLVKLRATQVLPTLGALLKHEDRQQRRYAARLVAELGDARGIELLREAERNEPVWRRRPFRRARQQLEWSERLETTPFEAP